MSLGNQLLLALCAALLLGLGLATSDASAETFTATCGNLQAKMEAAAKESSHGEGDVVQLNGICGVGSKPFKIPAGSNFALEGAPGGMSGFNGEGLAASLLVSEGEAGRLTIAQLIFEHGKSTLSGGALAVKATGGLTLSDDQFLENTTQDGNGGAAFIEVPSTACSATSSITITGSTFRGNLAQETGGGGGAVWAVQGCSTASSVLRGDTFEGNTAEVSGSAMYTGGALAFLAQTVTGRPRLEQTGNVFDSNKVLASAGSGMYGGGGEWVQGANLTSIADRFSRNSIPGSSGSGHWSWGGGLGILNQGCKDTELIESTLEDAVVAGNSIGSGEAADLGGAGIYADCAISSAPSHVALLDSTVTENTVSSGGVAGIDGGPEDALLIANSIVAQNTGGEQTGGFNGTGGSLTVTASDVCGPGSRGLAGTGNIFEEIGNICANPLLADNGNPASFDVHETSASPTIGIGSVARIPSGLTTDAFGDPRTQVRPSCGPSLPAGVDMGADEYGPLAVPSCAPPGHGPVPGLTEFIKLKTGRRAVAVTLGCKGASTQTCLGTLSLNDARSLSKQKVIGVTSSKQESKPLKLGESKFSLAGGRTVTFTVKLNSQGVSLLRRLHALSTVVLGSEAMPNNSVFLFLFHAALFTEPKHKAHKHKKHHHRKKHHPKKHR